MRINSLGVKKMVSGVVQVTIGHKNGEHIQDGHEHVFILCLLGTGSSSRRDIWMLDNIFLFGLGKRLPVFFGSSAPSSFPILWYALVARTMKNRAIMTLPVRSYTIRLAKVCIAQGRYKICQG